MCLLDIARTQCGPHLNKCHQGIACTLPFRTWASRTQPHIPCTCWHLAGRRLYCWPASILLRTPGIHSSHLHPSRSQLGTSDKSDSPGKRHTYLPHRSHTTTLAWSVLLRRKCPCIHIHKRSTSCRHLHGLLCSPCHKCPSDSSCRTLLQ